jgi:metallophosphoesterase superfamily enzyme
MNCADEPLTIEGIALRHTPLRSAQAFTIAGHVHPYVRLRDVVDGSSLRVPCFHFSPAQSLLPAFGSFTGGHVVRPREGDRIFAAGRDEVIAIEGVCA